MKEKKRKEENVTAKYLYLVFSGDIKKIKNKCSCLLIVYDKM